MSIHKKRRKVEICRNCHTILSLENNFCPHCGQENHDLKVPIEIRNKNEEVLIQISQMNTSSFPLHGNHLFHHNKF